MENVQQAYHNMEVITPQGTKAGESVLLPGKRWKGVTPGCCDQYVNWEQHLTNIELYGNLLKLSDKV